MNHARKSGSESDYWYDVLIECGVIEDKHTLEKSEKAQRGVQGINQNIKRSNNNFKEKWVNLHFTFLNYEFYFSKNKRRAS